MISYIDPKVELVPNPVALDNAIQSIQERIATLTWLEKSFGRAIVQSRHQENKEAFAKNESSRMTRDVVYPEVYNKREPLNVMMNDNIKSYSFFHVRDPLKFTDYLPLDMSTPAVQPISLITWVNLQKIDPAKQYNFSEELRSEMIKLLKFSTNFVITESFIGYDKIFNPFTITETFRQYLKPPYAGWRIDGELNFDFSTC